MTAWSDSHVPLFPGSITPVPTAQTPGPPSEPLGIAPAHLLPRNNPSATRTY
uniref:Uncharacterized protein n=1 Tax=Pyricularia oryzae (strain P131) TaxID=1143193 RepID=L7JC08_PYRO1